MRRIAIWLSLAVCAATVGVVAPATSASAAAGPCPKGTGVTVVVGDNVRCDPTPGGSGVKNMIDTQHQLTEVQSEPGFICRIDGVPASDLCQNTPPKNAYWAIWVSSGNGTWSYAQAGISGLEMPAGSWLGFKFQTTNNQVPPSVKPQAASRGSGGSGSGSGSTQGNSQGSVTGDGSAATGPSAGPSASAADPQGKKATKSPQSKKSTAPGSSPQAGGAPDPRFAPTAAAQDETSGPGSLMWVAAAIGLLLLVGMGTVLWQRKAARS